MDRRWGVVVAAGMLIAGVCAWRLATNVPQDYAAQLAEAKLPRPAAAFEGLDAHNQMFRLDRYLHRHRILLVFFSAELTAAGDPHLTAVRERFDALSRHDVKVVGVSTALPQENRAAMEPLGEFPFPLISDVNLGIHRVWGRLDGVTERPIPGVFLIDRKGTVSSLGQSPQPVDDLAALLEELTQP
ncbi:MAG: redoxin domain-containing protein [Planctomycetaceae bacterium]|nr:redoxin domain-containing protein [Planctomycetaceae bacterium]